MIAGPMILLALLAVDPTKPSLVALDFKDRPLPEVVAAIAARSGNSVVLQFYIDPPNNPRKITLQAAEPVPFWDAIDQFCAQTKIQRALNDGGSNGAMRANVSLYGPGGDPGPAHYAGPLRLGKFTLQAHFRKSFTPLPTSAIEPEDGYHAEFEVLPEPRVLAMRTGPLTGLEAIDESGRSLLDPKIIDPEKVSGPVNGFALGGYQSLVRVKLAAPHPDSKRLKLLKGRMPVEIAVPPKAPTLVIALADAAGKSFKTGDLAIAIEEFTVKPGGSTVLKVVVKIEGARGPRGASSKPLIWARSSMVAKLIEVADSEGRPLTASSSGTSGGDELRLTYEFAPTTPAQPMATPKSLRIYAPDWVAWEVPFEFRDVPLP